MIQQELKKDVVTSLERPSIPKKNFAKEKSFE